MHIFIRPVIFLSNFMDLFQGISISKAINQSETPVKEKHVRSILFVESKFTYCSK